MTATDYQLTMAARKMGRSGVCADRAGAGHTLTEAELIAHCREYIDGYQTPRCMPIVDVLAKSAMGL
jgi:acyl-CoA synthetase (AMP-forming)/AMP-acid ligase II